MTMNLATEAVVVSLPTSFIDALLKMHCGFDPSVLAALQSAVPTVQPEMLSKEPMQKVVLDESIPKKYAASFLGVRVSAWSLPEIFAQIVDMMAIAAPEELEKLAGVRARTRRYISRSREAIHPRSNHLPVMLTASGWWISKCIGSEDLKRALIALAHVSDLDFGRCVVFPAPKT